MLLLLIAPSIHISACLCIYSLPHNDKMMMMLTIKAAAGLVGYSRPASLQVILRVFFTLIKQDLPLWVWEPRGRLPQSSRRSSRHFLVEKREIRHAFSVSFKQACVFFRFCISSDGFPIASNIMFILLGFKPLIPDDHLIYLTSFFQLLLCCRVILFKNIHLADLIASAAADGCSISVIITKILQMFQSNISSVLHVSVFCVPSLLSQFWSACKWDTSMGIFSKSELWSSGCTRHA